LDDLGDVPAGIERVASESPPVSLVSDGREFDHRFPDANDVMIEPFSTGHDNSSLALTVKPPDRG
jgi:hypothetical protein